MDYYRIHDEDQTHCQFYTEDFMLQLNDEEKQESFTFRDRLGVLNKTLAAEIIIGRDIYQTNG